MAQISSKTDPEMRMPAGAGGRKPRPPLADESAALRDAFLGRTEAGDATPSKDQANPDKGPSAFARIAGQIKKQAKSDPAPAPTPVPAPVSVPVADPEAETSPWKNRLKLGKLIFAGMVVVFIVVQVPHIKDGLTEIAALQAAIDTAN